MAHIQNRAEKQLEGNLLSAKIVTFRWHSGCAQKLEPKLSRLIGLRGSIFPQIQYIVQML